MSRRNNWKRARALWSDVGALTRDLRERVAERPGLPDASDPAAVDAWISRQRHRHLADDIKIAIRMATHKMLESTNDPLHHKEAEQHLSYILGDTPEPRRYAGPGDVILTAAEAELVIELLDRVGFELATHPDRPSIVFSPSDRRILATVAA